MQFNIYAKVIKTGKVTHEKIITVTNKVYKDPSEMAQAIMKEMGLHSKAIEVSTLKSGKMDICIRISVDVRLMCYKLQEQHASVSVSPRRICDMLIGAFEGGSTYWAQEALYTGKREIAQGLHWYDMPELFTTGVIFKIRYDDPEKDEGNGEGVKIVTMNDIQKGLNIFASTCPAHFGDFIAENDDSITADCFLQCIVLGEVVYG